MKKLICKLLASRPSSQPVDWGHITSVLIRPIGTGIGDAVVLSSVIGQLKQAYPACTIGVLTTPRNRFVFKHIPGVGVCLDDEPLTYLTQRKKWQVFLDYRPTFTTRNIVCDFLLAPAYTVCFEKTAKKHYSPQTVHNYNCYVPDLAATHLSQSLSLTPFAAYVNTQNPHYVLTLPQAAQVQAQRYLIPGKKHILLCPFGSDRRLAPALLQDVLTQLTSVQGGAVQLIAPFREQDYPLNFPLTYTGPVSQAIFMALIKQADVCLAVDSAAVHIACALGTPVVAIYSSWVRNFTLFAPIGPCASSVRDGELSNGPVSLLAHWDAQQTTREIVKWIV